MLKRDYFIAALKAKSYLYKAWVIECFSKTTLPVRSRDRNKNDFSPLPIEPQRPSFTDYPYQLFSDGEQVVFFNPEIDDWEVLQGVDLNTAPFKFKEVTFVLSGDLPNIPEIPVTKENPEGALKTTYGNIIVNQVVICHAFGNKITYQNGKFSIKAVENKIAELLTSEPPEGEERNPKLIYTDELRNLYYPAVFSVSGWAQLGAPAATPYTIVTSPEIPELRRRLIEKYKDDLDDPAIIAKIMKELIDADVTFQSNDPEKGFLRPGTKDFDVVRAKTYIMHGVEYDFVDRSKITVIQNPLSDGWDITKLPEMANSLIDGSFNRGAMTALGGEAAKFIGRFFLNTVIAEEDCGSPLGKLHTVTKNNEEGFHWAYFFDESGGLTLMTPELASLSHGKQLLFRSPQYCHTKGGNFCVKCLGKRFENSTNSLGALATETGNIMMGIMMSSMHGRALKVEKWDWNSALN